MNTKMNRLWESCKESLFESFKRKEPGSYYLLFRRLIEDMATSDLSEKMRAKNVPVPDPTRITAIDHEDKEGFLLLVVFQEGPAPSVWWHCMVSYSDTPRHDRLLCIKDSYEKSRRIVEYSELAQDMVELLELGGRL
jgi:hypothetical protein